DGRIPAHLAQVAVAHPKAAGGGQPDGVVAVGRAHVVDHQPGGAVGVDADGRVAVDDVAQVGDDQVTGPAHIAVKGNVVGLAGDGGVCGLVPGGVKVKDDRAVVGRVGRVQGDADGAGGRAAGPHRPGLGVGLAGGAPADVEGVASLDPAGAPHHR